MENNKLINSKNAIPKRSKQAIEDLVNLNDYYTSSLDDNLSSFPKGVHAYEKAAFDIRGLIQLAGKNYIKESIQKFPEVVENIKVNVKGYKIHFLRLVSG